MGQHIAEFDPDTFFNGTWYDVARKDFIFSYRGTCCKAEYAVIAPKADGTKQVTVNNTCTSGEGVKAVGTPQGPTGAFTVKFEVPFFVPFAQGNYWVLWQSEDKQLTIVGEPCRFLMWVLSRTETPDEKDVQAAIDYANNSLGYNLKAGGDTLIRRDCSKEQMFE